jgi:hypothetical protein
MSDQPATSESLRAFDRPTVMVPVFTLIAAIGGLFESFTVGATLLIFGVGGTMVWLGVSGRAGRRPAPRVLSRGALLWLVPVLVLGLTEFYSFLHTPREDYPTVSWVFDPFLEHYLPRAVGWFAWLGGFWTLVRR